MKKDIFFEENQDVLRAIELEVVMYYRHHRELVDNNVEKVYNSLERVFTKEIQEKNPPKLRFTSIEQDLYDRVDTVCRLHTGEEDAVEEDREELESLREALDFHIISKDIIIKCMKRLRGSIKTWSGNVYGKRGYLDYISQFM